MYRQPDDVLLPREIAKLGPVDTSEARHRLRLIERANELGRHDLIAMASDGCGPLASDEKISSCWEKLEQLLLRPPPRKRTTKRAPRPRAWGRG